MREGKDPPHELVVDVPPPPCGRPHEEQAERGHDHEAHEEHPRQRAFSRARGFDERELRADREGLQDHASSRPHYQRLSRPARTMSRYAQEIAEVGHGVCHGAVQRPVRGVERVMQRRDHLRGPRSAPRPDSRANSKTAVPYPDEQRDDCTPERGGYR